MPLASIWRANRVSDAGLNSGLLVSGDIHTIDMVSTSNVSGGDTGIMDNMDSADNFSGGLDSRPADTLGTTGEVIRAIPPKRIEVSQISSILQQAETFQLQGRFNDASEICQQILESGFDRPDVRYFLGWLYLEQRYWDAAIGQFQKLLNDPDYALSCYYALGQCYRECGDMREARTHFDEALEQVNLNALTIEEADELVAFYQETIEAHHQLGEQEQALSITHNLLGFLRSRGWSDQLAQVEFMLDQLQNSLPPRLGASPAPASVPPHALQHLKQRVTRPLSAISLLLQRRTTSHPFRPNWRSRIIIFLLVGISLGSIGTGIGFAIVYQNSRATNSVPVQAAKTSTHFSPTSTKEPTPLPTPTPSVSLAGSYNGTLHNIPTGTTTNISLIHIQQQQGHINGYFDTKSQNSPFTGTIDNAKHIQFVVKSDTGQATFSFEGMMQADGSISGTYCGTEGTTNKCSDYGLWSVSPGP